MPDIMEVYREMLRREVIVNEQPTSPLGMDTSNISEASWFNVDIDGELELLYSDFRGNPYSDLAKRYQNIYKAIICSKPLYLAYKRAKRSKNNKRYYSNNIEKFTAKYTINQLVRKNMIKRPSICSFCGKKNHLIEGHHPDYRLPAVIIWLCRKCHNTEHKRINKEVLDGRRKEPANSHHKAERRQGGYTGRL
jgi:hypothetical protein